MEMESPSRSIRGRLSRFLNLASFKISLKIGETKHLLAEKNITDVSDEFEHGNYYQTMMLSLPEGEAEPVSAYNMIKHGVERGSLRSKGRVGSAAHPTQTRPQPSVRPTSTASFRPNK